MTGGIKAMIGYVVGVSFCVAIVLLAGVFSSLGFFAIPLAVLIIISPVLYLENVPWFDMLAASFAGAGCYFGIITYVPEASLGSAAFIQLFYGFLGLLWGWFTIVGRVGIAKAFEK